MCVSKIIFQICAKLRYLKPLSNCINSILSILMEETTAPAAKADEGKSKDASLLKDKQGM